MTGFLAPCVVRRPTEATRYMERVRDAAGRVERCRRELSALEYAMDEVTPWQPRAHGGGARGASSDPTASLAQARIEGLSKEVESKRAELVGLVEVVGAGLAVIDRVRHAVSVRAADVLELYYVDCAATWSVVADELGVSRETVRQDRDKALDWIDGVGLETARQMRC